MNITSPRRILGRLGMLGLAFALSAPSAFSADWPRRARNRPVQVVSAQVVVTTRTINTRQVAGMAPSPMLGSFYPDPSPINIRGNFEAGGGYSPLGTYGDTAANLIGPLSDFRTMAAPVLTYERGYDGSYRPGLGTGFSNPNFPAASPVVYPTRANVRNGPQRMTTPPQWDRAINWIDLN